MPKKLPNPADVKIGARVRSRRMELGISQEKLGDALGLTFQQVQKYEKGVNRIGGSRMEQIAVALKVAPGYFFDDIPGAEDRDETLNEDLRAFVGSREGLLVVSLWAHLKPRLRSAVVEMIKASAEA